ncbi:M48 family metallopeptidase [Micromonospora polyrhachis]|uniref:Zn-dependent protease with chaperone function n=1 Tax=Micromonospora polyrhachis TaxID=1282883 RepID=A0A7W7SR09_9ACTN|nr:M48 family metallopeptidase [Micromonospora polyrhachis]MBB4959365.1 Zn-dependent protease with chaperone function [Micromonospora polyrhachis]
MVATYRALASVVMLAGFYLVALVQLGAAVALVLWLSTVIAGAVAVKLVLPLFIALGGAVVALWRAIRTESGPAPGLVVQPDQAPQLWQLVHELAGQVGTRVPDEIRIVPEINAAVGEESKLLGLIGGRRTLYLGLPLVQALSVDQLRSVLAHELGHYSGRHTRFGAVAYRGRLAIGGTIDRIGPWNPVGWVFKGYARLYLMVDNAASQRQELEADRASVQVAGRAAAASALRELPALDAAWGFYFSRYVESGWEAGFAPDDLFGGFAELIAAREDELAALREQEPSSERSRWETHPPIGERIATMAELPEGTVTSDGRRATELLPDVALVSRRLQELMVDVAQRTVLPWPEFTAATIAAGVQRQADTIFRAAARLTGATDVALPTIFELVRANRLGEFAEQFFPDATRREAAQRFVGRMELLLCNAAVSSGVAHWQHSWSSPARLVDKTGEPLPLDEIAKLAVDEETLDEAEQRLTELGIDSAQSTLVQRQATATGADLIGGLANIKVDGVDHDLLILDRGFVFIGDPGKANKGEKRLRELVAGMPVAKLAEIHRFLPYEEVASVTFTQRTPPRAELRLHDGRTVSIQATWGGEMLEKKSRETLLRVLDSFDQ